MKKKKKNFFSSLITSIILVLSLCGLGYSGYKLYISNSDYREGETLYDNINEDFTKEYTTTSNDSDFPSYKYIDFKELKAINEDVVAWLYIPDSIVDYPVLQGDTNTTYLHTSIYKEYLYVGTLFLDCKNKPDFTDDNSIIYGHNMNDGSMFGTMENLYLNDEDFYKNHPYIQLYTPERKMTYQIIGAGITDRYSDRYTVNFNSRNEYSNWLKDIKENSQINSAQYDVGKETITLSTCHHHGIPERFVLHMQKVGSVSNNVYGQFYVNEGGNSDEILCYRSWETHRNFPN